MNSFPFIVLSVRISCLVTHSLLVHIVWLYKAFRIVVFINFGALSITKIK